MKTFLVLAVTAALLAGCAGSDGGGSTSPTSDGTDPGVRYSACMRSHGVPGFPDPVDGRLQINARPGSDLDPESSTFQAAEKACQSLSPAGEGRATGDEEQQAGMLKFVACMRENGVPDFPDPQPDGGLLIKPGSGVDPDSSAFQAAEAACRSLAPGGLAPGQ